MSIWKKIDSVKEFENIKPNDSWILKYTGDGDGVPKDVFSYSDADYYVYTVDSGQGDIIKLKSAPSTFNTSIWLVNIGLLHKSIQDIVEEGSWFYAFNGQNPVV